MRQDEFAVARWTDYMRRNKWVLNTTDTPLFFLLSQLIIAVVLFLVWEYFLETEQVAARPSSSRLRATDPMIPLALFGSRDVCIVMYATYVNGMVKLVMFYFVAIFFVIVAGLSPTQSGVQLIYFAPGMVGIARRTVCRVIHLILSDSHREAAV